MCIKNKLTASILTAVASCLGVSGVSHADPLQGEILKFQQLPLNNTPFGPVIYQGHDSPSTAYPFVTPNGTPGYQGFFFADDFADKFSTPVVHLKWWGSYINNPNNTPVNQFLISFESDVPAPPGTFSHPGTPLVSQIVNKGPLAPASGTFTETLINGNVPEHLYQYNAELNLGQTFAEQQDTVYWLKIVALTPDTSLTWGWHNRDYTTQDLLASTSPAVIPGENNIGSAASPIWHFQDDAVRGGMTVSFNTGGGLSVNQFGMTPTNYVDLQDGPQGISQFSQDMAFELYTAIPEPMSVGIVGLVAGLLLLRRQR
jgi:hypothetical protein